MPSVECNVSPPFLPSAYEASHPRERKLNALARRAPAVVNRGWANDGPSRQRRSQLRQTVSADVLDSGPLSGLRRFGHSFSGRTAVKPTSAFRTAHRSVVAPEFVPPASLWPCLARGRSERERTAGETSRRYFKACSFGRPASSALGRAPSPGQGRAPRSGDGCGLGRAAARPAALALRLSARQ